MAPFSAGGFNRPIEWASDSRGPPGLPVCFTEHHNSLGWGHYPHFTLRKPMDMGSAQGH